MSCRADSPGKLKCFGTASAKAGGQSHHAFPKILTVWMLLFLSLAGPAGAEDVRVEDLSVSPVALGTGAQATVAVELSGFLPRPVTLNLQMAIDLAGTPTAVGSESLEVRRGARRGTLRLRLNNPGTYRFTLTEPSGQNLLAGEESFSAAVTVRGDDNESLLITVRPFPNPASSSDELVLYLLLYELDIVSGSFRPVRLPEPLTFGIDARGCQRTIAEGGCRGMYGGFVPSLNLTIPVRSFSATVSLPATDFRLERTWEFFASNSGELTDSDEECTTPGGSPCIELISPLPGSVLQMPYYGSPGSPLLVIAEAWEVDALLPPPPPTRRERLLLLVGNTSPRLVPLSSTVTLSVFLADAEPTLLEQRLLPMLPTTLSLSLFASVCPPGRAFCGDDAVRAGTYRLTIASGEDSGQVEIPATALEEPGTWEFTVGPLVTTSTLFNPLLFSGAEPVSVVHSAPPQQINPEIYDYYGAGYIAALTTVLQVARLPLLRIRAPGAPVSYREPISLEVSVASSLTERIAVRVTARRADGLEMSSETTLGPEQSQAQLSFAPRQLPPGPWRFTATAAPRGIVDERGAEGRLSVLSALRLEPATTVLLPGAELRITAALDGVPFSTVSITVTASLESDSGITTAQNVVLSPAVPRAEAIFPSGALAELGRWFFTVAATPSGLVDTSASIRVAVIAAFNSIELNVTPAEVNPGWDATLTAEVSPPLGVPASMTVTVRAPDGVRDEVQIGLNPSDGQGEIAYVPDASSGAWTFTGTVAGIPATATGSLEVGGLRISFSAGNNLSADELLLALRYLSECALAIMPLPARCTNLLPGEGLLRNLPPQAYSAGDLNQLLLPDMSADGRGDEDDILIFLRYLAGIQKAELLLPEAARQRLQHSRARLRILRQLVVE